VYFALGWLIFFSSDLYKKIFCFIITIIVIYHQYGANSSYIYIASGGVLLTLALNKIKIPRISARIIGLAATSTYFTYLMHAIVLRVFQQKLGVNYTAVLVLLSFLAGLAGSWAWGHLLLAARSVRFARLQPMSPR
jgi:hypothetical protein